MKEDIDYCIIVDGIKTCISEKEYKNIIKNMKGKNESHI